MRRAPAAGRPGAPQPGRGRARATPRWPWGGRPLSRFLHRHPAGRLEGPRSADGPVSCATLFVALFWSHAGRHRSQGRGAEPGLPLPAPARPGTGSEPGPGQPLDPRQGDRRGQRGTGRRARASDVEPAARLLAGRGRALALRHEPPPPRPAADRPGPRWARPGAAGGDLRRARRLVRLILYRLFPREERAAEDEPGGPLWWPRGLQGDGRHDNPGLYTCMYTSETATS